MKVELITPMGDLTTVNAARVSMGKHHDVLDQERDPKLMRYLNDHEHFTTFTHIRETFVFMMDDVEFMALDETLLAGMVYSSLEFGEMIKIRHSLWGWKNLLKSGFFADQSVVERVGGILQELYPENTKALGVSGDSNAKAAVWHDKEEETDPRFIDVTLRVKAPFFFARQEFKHQVGFTRNEISRRYVDDQPEYWKPEQWRARPDKSIKQGSGGVITGLDANTADFYYDEATDESDCYYNALLRNNVAPEMARAVLPLATMTEYYVTGSLAAFARMYKLRIASNSQLEIQQYAAMVDEILTKQYGKIWSDLK